MSLPGRHVPETEKLPAPQLVAPPQVVQGATPDCDQVEEAGSTTLQPVQGVGLHARLTGSQLKSGAEQLQEDWPASELGW